jgi:hypothetical protein
LTSEVVEDPVGDLQARVTKIEELLGIGSERLDKNETLSATTNHPFLGTLVVKGNRSIYHGQNDRITLLNQVSLPVVHQANMDQATCIACIWRCSSLVETVASRER